MNDEYEYDDFEQSMAPEYEYDCEECGGASEHEGLCESCNSENPYDNWDASNPYSYGELAFADPGGVSALRAETYNNPRNLPCPTCGRMDMLTLADKNLGYQCDYCADKAERGY